jgi:hypothetical protein
MDFVVDRGEQSGTILEDQIRIPRAFLEAGSNGVDPFETCRIVDSNFRRAYADIGSPSLV